MPPVSSFRRLEFEWLSSESGIDKQTKPGDCVRFWRSCGYDGVMSVSPIRTSHSHPLQIASGQAGPGLGRIGLTFCPGKKQIPSMTGGLNRTLGVDLDLVAEWSAVAVVSLIESHEFEALQVNGLGAAVEARHMLWMHLPIPDVSVPDSNFEAAWAFHGERLRKLLRSGFDVLIHCKGGLGRAGMISARILVELGWQPGTAMAAVRQVRPGAIETPAQESHVRSVSAIPETTTPTDPEAVVDRALGCLLGLAVGDALETTLEFQPRD